MSKVFELVQRMLPSGSREGGADAANNWDQIPVWPPNVFAVTATLLERSSGYRHVIGPGDGEACPLDPFGVLSPEWRAEMIHRADAWSWGLIGPLGPADRGEIERYIRESGQFVEEQEPLFEADMQVLQEDWSKLVSDFGEMEISGGGEQIVEWWKPALRLMITADSASGGIGFLPYPNTMPTWVEYGYMAKIFESMQQDKKDKAQSDNAYIATLTSRLFNSSLGAVLPKTRSSALGCTLRSLSHHLALLPPPSQVEARWRPSGVRAVAAYVPEEEQDDEEAKPLNLLLIPFPYCISPRAFRPTTFSASEKNKDDWGYFEIAQTWLPTAEKDLQRRSRHLEDIKWFVTNLIQSGAQELGEINGVIFPELALDAETFAAISEHLLDQTTKANGKLRNSGFEFIIAGMSQRPDEVDGSHGNFATFRGLPRRAPHGDYAAASSWGVSGAREKHHRWKLNKHQIQRYGLSARLDPRKTWWEAISVAPRVVEFFEVRAGTSLTVLICEDLARADPCQTVVRSVGPNLVIALLMDGPQRAFRWPGHYAGVLADDPGSSVISFTSFGLIDRALATDKDQSRSVGYFKDNQGNERELHLPHGCHALALRLDADSKTEHTLDGRGDDAMAFVWRLSEVAPIRLPRQDVPEWLFSH